MTIPSSLLAFHRTDTSLSPNLLAVLIQFLVATRHGPETVAGGTAMTGADTVIGIDVVTGADTVTQWTTTDAATVSLVRRCVYIVTTASVHWR